MRQMSVISGHPISTGFRRLTGCQRDPRDRGFTSLPKLSYKTNTLSEMPIVTKTMNQIGPCVYISYNENVYHKRRTHK